MFEENENLVLDGTENVEEQATEELVDGVKVDEEEEQETEVPVEEPTETEPVKTYTEEEMTKRANEIANEMINKRLGRATDNIKKELEREYSKDLELASIVKQGIGIEDSSVAIEKMNSFYASKDIEIKPWQTAQPELSEENLNIIADNKATNIIKDGFEEVKYEVDRLAALINSGYATAEEKLIFSKLADYRTNESKRIELSSIGVKDDVIESESFKTFASQFKEDIPITKVYEQYAKTIDKPNIEKMGSMKTPSDKEVKTYYSPEDVDKLSAEDYDNPTVMKYVRESMQKWKNK